MATKKPQKPEDNTKWISCDLDDRQKAQMKEQFPSFEDVSFRLQDFVDSGYKFSVNIDKYNKCYSAYGFPTSEENPNFGSILTSRGNSVFAALRGLVFRHYGIFETVWGTWTKENIDEE